MAEQEKRTGALENTIVLGQKVSNVYMQQSPGTGVIRQK